jgi:putative oxidoreductase
MSDHTVVAVSAPWPPSKVLHLTLWMVQVLAAAVLCIAGGTKLAGADMHIAMFEKIGLGQWFRYVTGGLEVLGAILLLVPTTAAMGAVLLAAIMVGAMATHLFVIGGNPVPATVLLLMTLAVAWYRWPQLKHLIYSSRRR